MKEVFFEEDEFIISKTDLKGRITYGNALFIKISGYSEDELLGSPHNILRHPSMPRVIFKTLWNQIQAGKEIFAYVINQTKDGAYYWVFAQVTPSFDDTGNLIGYHSVRRRPKKSSLDTIIPLYKELLEAEKVGGQAGLDASQKLLNNKLHLLGKNYDQFILAV